MNSLLSRLFSLVKTPKIALSSQPSFEMRFYRFRMFLASYLDAYGELMAFEERLSDSAPIGMPFLRTTTTKLAVATARCIMELNALSGNQYTKLDASFSTLRATVQNILNKGTVEVHGPLVFTYKNLAQADPSIIAPNLVCLGSVAAQMPNVLPEGFIVTGAAWWEYFNNPDMHEEIDRLIIISQEDTASYNEASTRIRELLKKSFPLPASIIGEVSKAVAELKKDLDAPEKIVLLRCIPLHRRYGALTMPEQAFTTPCSLEAILDGLHTAFIRTYQARAMIYRMKLGIRDRAMPFCLSFSLLPAVHARGSVHKGFTPTTTENVLHIRKGLSETIPGQYPLEADQNAVLPQACIDSITKTCEQAFSALAKANLEDTRHEIFWAAGENNECILLGASPLAEPEIPSKEEIDALCAATQQAENTSRINGGIVTFPGVVHGKLYPVRNLEDALLFPIGSILCVNKAMPRWSFLHDFARGAIAGDGTGHGIFARTARRFGSPTILHSPMAVQTFSPKEPVCVSAIPQATFVCRTTDALCEKNDKKARNTPVGQPGHYGTPGKLWVPDSDIANMTRELAPLLLANTLPDNDAEEFRTENCNTFRNILVFMYKRAVRDIFTISTSAKTSTAPAKQLVCDVPKQFWVINLNDGFTKKINGPTVSIQDITCLPLHAFWKGFDFKPWDGPPQLDAKGFLSILYEATLNPDLDPATQSNQYTEKNIFMISKRFCSLRCRFGFHFLALDCLLSEREKERFIIFQFKGGAANLSRRIKRVRFVADILGRYGFTTERAGDTLSARVEQGSSAEFIALLRTLGYLFMHTRQLDMIMADEDALANKKKQMIDDMDILFALQEQ